jgi:peptidoglycan/xylan/chitin deacetylase (PgdA/CDA1 family)
MLRVGHEERRTLLWGVPRVALTFDDGPGPITGELLDVLRDAGWPATFFVLGKNVEEAPWCGDPARARGVIVRELREGHVVAHHTYSHAQPSEYRDFARDFARGEAVVRTLRVEAGWEAAAAAAPVPFRLPYGVRLVERTVPTDTGTINVAALDPRLPILASLGRAHLHWTADFGDWDMVASDGPGLADRLMAHAEAQAALGLDAVMCLHDSGSGSGRGYERPATLAAVRLFVDRARRAGFEPFTIPAG